MASETKKETQVPPTEAPPAETPAPTTEKENEVEGEENKEPIRYPIFIKNTISDRKEVVAVQVQKDDNVQEIRQFLFEAAETCFITSYDLFIGNEKLNDFVEIQEIPQIKAEVIIEMREAFYNEKGIKLHIQRLRDIISAPPPISAALPRLEEKDSTVVTEEKNGEVKVQTSLNRLFPLSQPAALPSCVKKISFSGWNPVPGNRRLSGDLIYLEVETLENRTFHITGSVTGFFLNASNHSNFNPLPHPTDKYSNNTLAGLLSQLSPLFRKNFPALVNEKTMKNPVELPPVPLPPNPWISEKEKHTYDLNRSEGYFSAVGELELSGQIRDWNEEYQSCKELPSETIPERVVRDRIIYKINTDFVEMAIKGARAIVSKSVLPLNPLEPESTHIYLWNNIFFSYATDSRDLYKDLGGDRAAYDAVNNDLKALRYFNRADIKGVHSLLTAVIDYKGNRLVAQNIIPGILQREVNSTVIYGSTDFGKTIVHNEEFHETMKQVGKHFRIKEHIVKSREDKDVKICSPVEAKGILGSDNRKYLLDLVRMTPRDLNYKGNEHHFTLLRIELVTTYCEFLRQQRKEKEAKAKKAEEEAKKKEEEEKNPKKPEEATTTTTATPAAATTEKGKEKEGEKKEEEEEKEQPEPEKEEEIEHVLLNPNLASGFTVVGPKEELEADEDLLLGAAIFLKETVVPLLVTEMSNWIAPAADGPTLTNAFHNFGVNMRYLGLVSKVGEKNPLIKEITIREMITRASKFILNEILRKTEPFNEAIVISHFLNCLFSSKDRTIEKKSAKKKKKKNPSLSNKLDGFSLNHSKLWARLTTHVKERFNYDLPVFADVSGIVQTLSTLRSVCQKVGIQIEAREFELFSEIPFTPADIINLHPVVKHLNPETGDGKNMLESAKRFLSAGRPDIAMELFSEALSIFHQVYGIIHRDVASCYENIATFQYNTKELEKAMENQLRSTIINERVLGLDHFETAHSYSNLSLIVHVMGDQKAAIMYAKRALYLGNLICGPLNLENAASYMNIAMMLQEIKEFQLSISYLNKALSIFETLLGKKALETASIYHALAIAHGKLGNFKEALAFEKLNYAIVEDQVGNSDLRTIESNIYLKQFTQAAVQAQMDLKKGKKPIKMAEPATIKGTPIGLMPIADVLSYVNGKKGIQKDGPTKVPQNAKPAIEQESAKKKKKPKKNGTQPPSETQQK